MVSGNNTFNGSGSFDKCRIVLMVMKKTSITMKSLEPLIYCRKCSPGKGRKCSPGKDILLLSGLSRAVAAIDSMVETKI